MKALSIRKFGGAQILPWITFLAIAVVWCVLSYGGLVGPLFVPSPTAVFDKITSGIRDGSLLQNCWASTRRVMVGWFFSALLALRLIVAAWRQRLDRRLWGYATMVAVLLATVLAALLVPCLPE